MTPQAKTNRSALLGLLVIGLLLVGIVATISLRQALNAAQVTPTPTAPPQGVIPLEPPRDLADFTLPGTSGQPISLSSLQGKFALLFFGYTHCPDFCPLTLAHWRGIKSALGDDAAKLSFLFVSVDGERDRPEILAQYLSRFDPAFVGMSGDDATLAEIAPPYGLYYELHKDEGENYSVDHTTQSYLLNPAGDMIDVFSFDTPEETIVEVIRAEMARAAE